MSKDTPSKRIDVIAEEAARWYVQLKEADAKSKAEFAAWLKTSPEHVKEFLAVAAIWEALPELSAQPSVEELVAVASADGNVLALSSRGRGVSETPFELASVRRRWQSRFSIAATLAAAIIGGALMLSPSGDEPNLFTTSTGEQTSLPLPDGSFVTLNTQTTLRVSYSDKYRNIYLSNGEALFDVTKNPERPFRVITESAVIRAVGTQFNVLSHLSDVKVTVVEGSVDVSLTGTRENADETPDQSIAETSTDSVRITIGQQALVRPQSSEVAVVDTNIETAIAWRQRRLVIESLPLLEVIREFNRYNDPPLVIDDAVLEDLPISGVFRSNDRESFVQFLAQMELAESHTRVDGTIVLRGYQRD